MSRYVLSMFTVLLGVGVVLSGCIPPLPSPGPEASFTASETSGLAPLHVQFTDTSTGENPILSWNWDFGDGVSSAIPNPAHTYFLPGTYTVTLTVINGDGSKTTTRQNFITVTNAATFEPITPEGGSITVAGVTITTPPFINGTKDVFFGITESNEQAPLNPSEGIVPLSPTYRITHNADDEDFYLLNEGELLPSSIRIAFNPDTVPALDLERAKIQVLVRLGANFNVPILGFLFDNTITVPVLRFPEDATYTVIYRPEAQLLNHRASNVKEATTFDWPKDWEISLSEPLAQELAALDIGTLGDPTVYDRRNFTSAETGASIESVKTAITAIHTAIRTQGARTPLLTRESNFLLPGAPRFTLLFYDMGDTYTVDFTSFRNLNVSTHFFGQIVVDPRQLLMVTKSNALTLQADPTQVDLNQEYVFANAFGEQLADSVFEGYGYPAIPAADPSIFFKQGNGRDDFLAGLKDGLGVFLGQVLSSNNTARAFDNNEFAVLTQPLLTPERTDVPGYSVSNQEFFLYLDKAFPTNPRYDAVFSNEIPVTGILERLRESLAEQDINPTLFDDFVLFQAATLFMREAVDDALSDRLGTTLSNAYLNYVLDRAIENGPAAMLRPSDATRPALTFNHDRFESETLITRSMTAPTDTVTVSADDEAALEDIPPLSSRAIVLNVYPFASELTLTFNTLEWQADDNGNSVQVVVYEKGKPGVMLGANDDAVTIFGLDEDPENCLTEVVVLIINTSKSTSNSIAMTANSVAALDVPESQVLDNFVRSCDPNIAYTASSTVTNGLFGVNVTTLTLESGAWRSMVDVDKTQWTHTVTLIEPPVRTSDKALLFITGGSTGSTPDPSIAGILAPFALSTGSTIALIQAVPNQPLIFTGETKTRSEDAILAFSYDKYMDGFDAGKADMAWPALLPMTRAAVAAMDAAQDFVAVRGTGPMINKFVVSGASKRGWTTWLTAVTDPRVSAIMPIVIDVLNMAEQMQHHFSAYGFFSNAIKDYVDLDIFGRFGQPEGDSLLAIVDPYSYLDRLTMPKFVMNATGDQFFLPDSTQFYWDELLGDNRLNYTPNVDHGLTNGTTLDQSTVNALLAYYIAHVQGVAVPSYNWTISPDNRITVTTATQPSSVKLWSATNPVARDFRLETIGAAWNPTNLSAEPNTSFTYVGEVPVPAQGWTAFYIQLTWPGPDTGAFGEPINYTFSTQIKVVPDVLPF